MACKYSDAFLLNAKQSFESGMTVKEFRATKRVSPGHLVAALRDRLGYTIPRTRTIAAAHADTIGISAAYKSGESVHSLSKRYGVGRECIASILKLAGVVLRDGNSAARIRMSKLSVVERQGITKRARATKLDNLGDRARSKRVDHYIGQGESELFDLLYVNGRFPIRQFVTDPYYVDLLVGYVAVEVKFRRRGDCNDFGGAQRIKKLIEGGMVVCGFLINDPRVIAFARNEIITLLDFIGRQPPTQGEYWVIRCTFDKLAALQLDINEIADVPVSPQVTTSISKRYFS